MLLDIIIENIVNYYKRLTFIKTIPGIAQKP